MMCFSRQLPTDGNLAKFQATDAFLSSDALRELKCHIDRSWVRWLLVAVTMPGLSFCIGLLGSGLWASALRGEEVASTSDTVPRIEAGVRIAHEQSGYWNRVVLLSRPKISSGDVDSLPAAVRASVSQFVLTIMASVAQTTEENAGGPRYSLADIGVGYSTEIDGILTSVSVAEADKTGLKLGLFARMMLAENEKNLTSAKLTTRTSTLAIIDAPAIVLCESKHCDYVMRHFVWVDSRTGRTAALVWLIKRDPSGGYVVETKVDPRWVPAGAREDRAIHVDGEQFNLFGVPTDKAFAIENLPPGKPIPWTAEAQAVAGLAHFEVDSLQQLSTALNNMLRSTVR